MEEKIKTFELNAESVNMIVEALNLRISMLISLNELVARREMDERDKKCLEDNDIRIAKLKTLLDYFLSQDTTTASDKHPIIECNGVKYAIGFESWEEIATFANGRPISILKRFKDEVYMAHTNLTKEIEDSDVLDVGTWKEVSDLIDCMEDSIHINKDAKDLALIIRGSADDFDQMAELQPNEFYTFDYGIVKKEGLSYKSDKYKINWHYAVKL